MPVDTQWQNFWKESIRSETDTRMRWSLTYDTEFQRMIQDPNLQETKMPSDRFGQTSVTAVEHPMESYNVDKQYFMKKPPPAPGLPPQTETGVTLDMYPADAKTKAVLYEGLSHNYEGAYAYLRARNKLYPDQKWPFEACSSWQYGWGSQDAEIRGPRYANVAMIKEEFYRKNGLHWTRDQGKKEIRFINTLQKE